MRSKNVLLVIALLAIGAYSMKFDISQFVEVKELNDPYTNELIQTINTELSSKGGRIEEIQKLLTDLYTKLMDDQKRADKDWYERERFLNTTIADTQGLINRLADQIAAAQKKLALTNQKINRAEINLKQYSIQATQEKAMVVSLDIRRNEDKAIYMDNVYTHQNLLMALDQVMIALRKLKGSIAGIGLPSGVKPIAAETRDLKWKKEHGAALMQIFSEEEVENFIQVATSADQDMLEKLLGLLERLRNATAKSLVDDDKNEQESKRIHKFLRTQLTNDIEKLEGILTRQKRNLKAYKALKNSLTVEINEKSKLKKKNEEFLKQTIEIRRTERLKYENDKREREREKTVILKLQKIVDERLAKLSAFVKARVNQ